MRPVTAERETESEALPGRIAPGFATKPGPATQMIQRVVEEQQFPVCHFGVRTGCAF